MSLVFVQTKPHNDRPAWKVFRNSVLLGRVSHLGSHLGEYGFRAHDLALFTASELRELAEFIEEAQVEPLTLTLEEFMAKLGNERNVSLVRYTYPDGTEQWAANNSWGDLIEWAHTWPELGTKLLGVPVVPRDEVAELRKENHALRTEAHGWLKHIEVLEAAIREWAEATDEAEMFELDQTNAYGTDHADAEHRVEAAAQALRRLSGPCPSCEGRGYDYESGDWSMDQPVRVACPDCAGTGRAENSITANEKLRDVPS